MPSWLYFGTSLGEQRGVPILHLYGTLSYDQKFYNVKRNRLVEYKYFIQTASSYSGRRRAEQGAISSFWRCYHIIQLRHKILTHLRYWLMQYRYFNLSRDILAEGEQTGTPILLFNGTITSWINSVKC